MKEVIVIGVDGVWAKGDTLDEAFEKARKIGSLGEKVGIAVLPKEAEGYVDDYGGLTYKQGFRSEWVPSAPGKKLWPNRRTHAMREAVAKALT